MIYQAQQKLDQEQAKPKERTLAYVAGVYADGLSLRWEPDGPASSKHYKCNRAVTFAVGDLVKVCPISGTYLVEYPVGNPVI